MNLRRLIVSMAVVAALAVPPMADAVLCQKRSGVLVVREACKRKERVADPVALGLQGPPGPQGPQGNPGVGPLATCPPDAVLVGTTCVDRYEASLWQVPASASAVVTAIRSGTVTLAELTAAGATQVGSDDAAFNHTPIPPTFPRTGNWTAPVYAASIPGVLPSTSASWFQAEQACALSAKRLITNQEWQRAAAGTPDSGVDDGATLCNISATGAPSNTGARSACVSSWGAFDMVGNVSEWVADWGDLNATVCTSWSSEFGNDASCVGGDGSANLPSAWLRDGYWSDGASAGIFAVYGNHEPWRVPDFLGFRCAR